MADIVSAIAYLEDNKEIEMAKKSRVASRVLYWKVMK